MRRNPRFFRLTATVALAALVWDAALPLVAMAQPAPPPLPPAPSAADQPNQNLPDPPARVGRVARITGTVSFHNQGDTQWSAAGVNFPVSSGNAFWTEPAATAELEISASRITMAGGSEFDVATLDSTGLQGVAAQGETYLRLSGISPDEAWSIQTPRGLVHLGGQGRYDIIVGTTEQPTLITVIDGSARIDGPDLALQLSAGQTATVSGTDSFQGSVGPVLRSSFLTERLNAERPLPAVQVPAQIAAMPGGEDLYQTGSWSQAPEYGQVWYPPVSAGWVPYREGHWAFVAPWGWTWIDDAPWGFAPFHYGRWVEIGGRWAWTPGEVAVVGPPFYAPALVAFIGIGAGVALGAALASHSVGWVPLGPREPFRPWFHASPRFIEQVNVRHVTNINNVTINNFVNRRAATAVPTAAMTGSRPIRPFARPISAQEFAAARPIVGQQPLRPVATTAGVTPAVARQMNIAPAPGMRPAPGPAVRFGAAGTGFTRPATIPAPQATIPAPQATQPNRPAVISPGARPTGISPGAVTQPMPPGEATRRAPGFAAPPQQGTRPALPQVVTPQTVTPQAVGPHPGMIAPQPTVPMQPGPRPALPQVIGPHPGGGEPPRFTPVQPSVREPMPHVATPRPTEINPPHFAPVQPPARQPLPQVIAPHIEAAPPRQMPPTFQRPMPQAAPAFRQETRSAEPHQQFAAPRQEQIHQAPPQRSAPPPQQQQKRPNER